MGRLDDWIAGLMGGGSLAVVMLVALLLGLRHATDPDHLTAVSTLIVADARHGAARARRLGMAWGAGHATTLVAVGLPIVLLGASLPEPVRRAAEAAIGAIIAALALRLLLRWRRGAFHTHPHSHEGVVHAHPHAHAHEPETAGRAGRHPQAHAHRHAEALGRTPLAAYGIGLVHGVGGSAGIGLVLLGGISSHVAGAAALLAFALATAVSMTFVTAAFGSVLARGRVAGRLGALAPALGTGGLVFGVWYALGAL
jgi:ABC-type nickel/cobalt efflux system permease component RcnA